MPDDAMFQEAINAVRKGEKTRAKDLLTRLIKADPNKAEYWIWMSAVVDTTKERIYCLNEARKRDPENTIVRRGLVLLGGLPPETPSGQPGTFIHRNWQASFNEPLTPKPESPFSRRSAPRAVLYGIAFMVVVGLLALVLFPPRIKSIPVARTLPPTLKPSATLLPTGSPVVRTATPTFTGPTPLWLQLEQTYTPTPLYVDTPHPRSEAYRAAISAYLRNDWKSVIGFMQQVVRNESDAADGFYYLGESYRHQGEFDQALEQYNQAIKANINFAPAFLGRARANFNLDAEFDILPDLERAITIDPELGEAYIELANLALRSSDPKAALGYLDEAATRLPGSPLVSMLRAQANLLDGDSASAVFNAQHAHQLDRTLLEAYYILGQSYQADGQIGLSQQPLETFLVYNPEHSRALALLGISYYAQGRMGEALEKFTQALAQDQQIFEAYLYRGLIYLEQENWEGALDDLSAALDLDEKSAAASLGKGKALFHLGDFYDAYMELIHTEANTQIEHELAEVYYWRAQSLEKLNRMPAALEDWLKLLALPESATIPEWRAAAMAALGITATPLQTPTPTDTPIPTTTTTIQP